MRVVSENSRFCCCQVNKKLLEWGFEVLKEAFVSGLNLKCVVGNLDINIKDKPFVEI